MLIYYYNIIQSQGWKQCNVLVFKRRFQIHSIDLERRVSGKLKFSSSIINQYNHSIKCAHFGLGASSTQTYTAEKYFNIKSLNSYP